MATITDLTKSSVEIVDGSTPEASSDSNVNVYEFGNLILADILPTWVIFLNAIADLSGDTLTIGDLTGSSLSESDLTGASLDISDRAGSLVSAIDNTMELMTDSNINVYEFGNLLLADILPTILWLVNYIQDESGTSVSATDTSEATVSESDLTGVSITEADITMGNSIEYDYNEYTYEDSRTNYDGHALYGAIVDISGT